MLQGADLLGDGVNVAARIQAVAEPGGICISGSVYDQIRNKLSLSFRSLGEKTYKNIPHQVRTYSIAESDEFGSLPADSRKPFSHLALIVAGLAGILLLTGFGYWAYGAYQERQITAHDGSYSGDVCMGPTREDDARCYTASGIKISKGDISAKYPARGEGLSNVITGKVFASGDIVMEINIENARGARIASSRLTGFVRSGQLIANGDGFRTYKVNWRRY